VWHENGKKKLEEWCLNGGYHRIDGPAYIEWYENGNKRVEEWILNGYRHRIDGPAHTNWYKNGKKKLDKWCKYDNLQYMIKYRK
jgi:antitoxin component YwqK of YwqJK toxin-antitoxin module